VRVIHDTEQRLLLGHLRHQAERGQRHHERVRIVASGKAERDAERPSLRLGERVQPVKHRGAQLVQPGERELHLGLDASGAHYPEAGCLPDELPEQCRLPDTRFAAHNDDAASAIPDTVQQLPQSAELTASPVEVRQG